MQESPRPNSKREVFIGSMGSELDNYQQAAIVAVRRASMTPQWIDPGITVSVGIIRHSLNYVNQADIFVSILADNYGSVPYGYDISIMEMEYRQAEKRGIPIIVFISEKKLPESNVLEPDPVKAWKLTQLKKELREKYPVQTYTTPLELGDKLYIKLISKELNQ